MGRAEQILSAIGCSIVLVALSILLPIGIWLENIPLLIIAGIILVIPMFPALPYALIFSWVMTLWCAGMAVYFWIKVIRVGWNEALAIYY